MQKKSTRKPLPFRYPGGKFYAMDILRPFWQCVLHDEYREPFAGGATVFFNKKKAEINWLNDLDHELITCYEVMQNESTRERLVEDFATEIATPERWREVFESKPGIKYDIGKKYYYLNRTSFSGKLVSAAWGYRPKRSLPPERWYERILPCGKFLEGVKLTSLDFSDVINAPGENVLLYVDPPYYLPPKHKHYRCGFDLEDHVRLAEILKTTNHKFFLTYDDCKEIRDLYKWANVYDVKFLYRVDNAAIRGGERKVGFELIITNYDVPNQSSPLDIGEENG